MGLPLRVTQHAALAGLTACIDCILLPFCTQFLGTFFCCCRLYEEVEPDRILDERPAASGEGREFLVQYKVGCCQWIWFVHLQHHAN
jgi:hypothetical protein